MAGHAHADGLQGADPGKPAQSKHEQIETNNSFITEHFADLNKLRSYLTVLQ